MVSMYLIEQSNLRYNECESALSSTPIGKIVALKLGRVTDVVDGQQDKRKRSHTHS